MYINFKNFQKSSLSGEDLVLLCAIKQGNTAFIESFCNLLPALKEKGLITEIKGTKKQTETEKLRVSKKGSKLLLDLCYEGDVDEETIKIAEWIVKAYKNRENGFVRNIKELERRIQWFKKITNINNNFLVYLIKLAMLDTYDPSCGLTPEEARKENPRLIMSNMAENLFWKSDNIFNKRYKLEESELFKYYEDNKEFVHAVWERELNEDGSKKIK